MPAGGPLAPLKMSHFALKMAHLYAGSSLLFLVTDHCPQEPDLRLPLAVPYESFAVIPLVEEKYL